MYLSIFRVMNTQQTSEARAEVAQREIFSLREIQYYERAPAKWLSTSHKRIRTSVFEVKKKEVNTAHKNVLKYV